MSSKKILDKLATEEDKEELAIATLINNYTTIALIKADLEEATSKKKMLKLQNNIDNEIFQICNELAQYMISNDLDEMEYLGILVKVDKETKNISFEPNPNYNY
ncbi:DNA-binding HxlR family transcriptional regulator [Methanococcus voltae PS]|uniref:DNA-binding HxlR family transcriptional regulator n=1 Tax=Methanococcus voltae PS TaxID=523842 RepID=A0ABT2F0A8_METVO|nr:hypothetical protein [Methanococcus voltae]MCS3922945.1 DNA-binding HxlR family transcriptional regulator [Methanococcus voltae PS]